MRVSVDSRDHLRKQVDGYDQLTSRILDAALACFADRGVRRTTMNTIAEQAGVGVATVYRRFPQKEQLATAVVVREVTRLFAGVENAIAGAGTAEDQLVEGFVTFATEIAERSLLRDMLDSDSGAAGLLVSGTGSPILELGRGFIADIIRRWQNDNHEPAVAAFDADIVAEIFARLAHSLALSPDGMIPTTNTDQARHFARTYLIPLLTPRTPH